jgi:adenylate cyclase
MSERKRTRHIEQIFGKYVSKEVENQIVLQEDGRIPLTEREVSILFVDMSDHSNWVTQIPIKQLADELNEFMDSMVQAVLEHGGTVSRFMGDGLMALYNAPVDQSDHALRAIKSGLSMQKRIKELNDRRMMESKQPIYVRIGINTGLAMAGALGGKDRFEYTVIGHSVNMAKRAEEQCEPGKVAVTDKVISKLNGAVKSKYVGKQTVKGGVFELYYVS